MEALRYVWSLKWSLMGFAAAFLLSFLSFGLLGYTLYYAAYPVVGLAYPPLTAWGVPESSFCTAGGRFSLPCPAPSPATIDFARVGASRKAGAGMRQVRCSKAVGTGIDGWPHDCFSLMLS